MKTIKTYLGFIKKPPLMQACFVCDIINGHRIDSSREYKWTEFNVHWYGHDAFWNLTPEVLRKIPRTRSMLCDPRFALHIDKMDIEHYNYVMIKYDAPYFLRCWMSYWGLPIVNECDSQENFCYKTLINDSYGTNY